MFFNVHFFIFLIVTFMIFLPRAYSPWTSEPEIPENSIVKSCRQWIQHYGFKALASQTPDNIHVDFITENVGLVKIRERKYDQIVCVWAAIYAHVLGVFPNQNYISPEFFCTKNKKTDELMPYLSLKSTEETCEGWINFYKSINDDEISTIRALYKHKDELDYISIWPAIYGRFIEENINKFPNITSSSFCQGIGMHEQTIQFMSLKETKLSCQRWIAFTGYTENLKKNKQIAQQFHPYFKDYVNSWTLRYTNHLLNSGKKTPYEFCKEFEQYELFSYFNLNMIVYEEEI